MQPASLYQDENWSSDEEDSIQSSQLLASVDGYVSFDHMPAQNEAKPQPSWVEHEQLQRAGSFATAPKHFQNFQLQKNKLKLKRPKLSINLQHRDYVSLFPKLDLLIWYLPTYILRNRSKKYLHYIFLLICLSRRLLQHLLPMYYRWRPILQHWQCSIRHHARYLLFSALPQSLHWFLASILFLQSKIWLESMAQEKADWLPNGSNQLYFGWDHGIQDEAA